MIYYLDRLREIGVSQRMVEAERDGWILVAARWPDRIREWMPSKLAQLDEPQLVRLYRLGSEILESDAGDDDPRLEEVADIMAGLLAHAYNAGEIDPGEEAHDDLPHGLLDALAVESDPRTRRLLDPDARARLGQLDPDPARAAGGATRLTSWASVHTWTSLRSRMLTLRHRSATHSSKWTSGWPTFGSLRPGLWPMVPRLDAGPTADTRLPSDDPIVSVLQGEPSGSGDGTSVQSG